MSVRSLAVLLGVWVLAAPLTAFALADDSVGQGTPRIVDPETADRLRSDRCAAIAQDQAAVEKLKDQALASLSGNANKAFLENIPVNDLVAQCKYYRKVIERYEGRQ